MDGQPAAAIAADDRGLAYGDGLFETLRVVRGQPRLLERHLQRLATGCQRLQLNADLAAIRQQLEDFAAQLGEGVCKLILTRGSGRRGYGPDLRAAPRCLLQGSPAPVWPTAHAQGVRLYPCTVRLAWQPLLAGLKHLNRLEQVLARAEWQDGLHAEGLMCDPAGHVIEGVFSNLFLGRAGELWTPDLGRCGVAGVMRAEILARARRLGMPVQVREIGLEAFLQADEVFVCNSLYGLWPVTAFREQIWPVGPLTRQLQGALAGLLEAS